LDQEKSNNASVFCPPTCEVPSISTDQMIAVDRAMVDDYKIGLIQMMENAGRNLARLARARFLQGDPIAKHIVILAGSGGNGGGALVCARHLHNWGADVRVHLAAGREKYKGVPAHQLDILTRMKLPIFHPGEDVQVVDIPAADLIIDGLVGYSLSGAPRGPARDLIEWANEQSSPVLSLDAPSGLDTASGVIHTPTVIADATMTLALPKTGLQSAQRVVGELYLADISVPPALYSAILGFEVGPLFANHEILNLATSGSTRQ
jgi:NAD(P)H-hydrate epimerase